MTHTQTTDGYVLRLFKGEEIVESISTFCQEQSISSAEVRGIGGVTTATIGFYNLKTHEYEFDTYEETLEIISLLGNISTLDNKPFLHAHISLGRQDKSVVGGHLKEAVIGGTGEVFLRTLSFDLKRAKDDDTGLSLWDLRK